MIRLTTLLVLPVLMGCDLGPLEGKPSQFQLHQERIMALEAKYAELTAPVAPVAEPEPEPPAVPVYEPEPEPACVPVFRITYCED